ncbi:hypothetical protein ACJOV8_016075 [Formosa sp. 3Alg 14/1]|uniref:hypothetical protein n=1 Tax=Formosa sp. 3Alg 14/1 TaxID=3382190 RepID=UPI0039BE033A
MKSNSIKILECFNFPESRFLTELQHNENGIPPNTEIVDSETGKSWIIKSRALSGILLIADLETKFDCETELEHISNRYKNNKERETAIEKELEKRKNGIYWYLLKAKDKKQKDKPKIGTELTIKTTPQHRV